MCIRGVLFYNLIGKRDLLTKLNIPEAEVVQSIGDVRFEHILKFNENSPLLYRFGGKFISKFVFLLEYIFDQRPRVNKQVSVKTDTGMVGGSSSSIKSLNYDIRFYSNVINTFDFFSKISVFTSKAQLEFFNCVSSVEFCSGVLTKNRSYIYNNKITYSLINRTTKNQNVTTRWSNFRFLTNVPKQFNNINFFSNPEDRFCIKFLYKYSKFSGRFFLLVMSMFRVIQFFKYEK